MDATSGWLVITGLRNQIGVGSDIWVYQPNILQPDSEEETYSGVVLHTQCRGHYDRAMQALRTKVLAQGSLRAIRGGGNRASKGLGWYKRYQEIGPDAFRKARAPTPFNWENREVWRVEKRRWVR